MVLCGSCLGSCCLKRDPEEPQAFSQDSQKVTWQLGGLGKTMGPTLVNKRSEGSLREPAELAGGDKREGLDVGGLRQRRLDMPIVRKRRTVAIPDLHAMGSEEGTQEALRSLVDEMYAATSRRPREAQLATWIMFHAAWFGTRAEDPFKGAFPLDECKIMRVSALFKASGYKSHNIYMRTTCPAQRTST